MLFATGDDARRLEVQIEQEDDQQGITIPWKTATLIVSIIAYGGVLINEAVKNWKFIKRLRNFKETLDKREQPAVE